MGYLEIIRSKIISIEKMVEIRCSLKSEGKTIVFTNGCFDIVHLGHIEYLSKARDHGDVLIVGLNTDASVSRIKGSSRPVQKNETRAMVLAALQFVDFVVFFDDDTPLKTIQNIKPDILVKGADYTIKNIAGAEDVIKNGGKVLTIELTDGYSTTSIISKLLLHN